MTAKTVPLKHFVVSRGSAAADNSVKRGQEEIPATSTHNTVSSTTLGTTPATAYHTLHSRKKPGARARAIELFLFRSCNDYTRLPHDGRKSLDGLVVRGVSRCGETAGALRADAPSTGAIAKT
jgi:hypothetical protein